LYSLTVNGQHFDILISFCGAESFLWYLQLIYHWQKVFPVSFFPVKFSSMLTVYSTDECCFCVVAVW
jgi:hypothetical protein